MKLNKEYSDAIINVVSENYFYRDYAKMLIDHFNYSIKDINSHDELTNEEKLIISEKLFNELTK